MRRLIARWRNTLRYCALRSYFTPVALRSRAKASWGGAGASAARVAPSSAGQKSPIGSCREAGALCAAWEGTGAGASGVIHTSPLAISSGVASGAAAATAVSAIQAAAAAVNW